MVTQFFHDYLGFGHIRSRCKVKIFSDDGENFILFEDINLGTSVTNASELLATQIVNKMQFDPKECRFFETYSQYNYDSFDEIEYTWKIKTDYDYRGFAYEIPEAQHPRWKPAPENIKKLFLD